ncbi:hypothetical protein K435DRAFT_812308 [Dendrothele bispora CBS 962.96]|uniref:Restriction of telomere capping protein 4 C-terminal domain-containing protein n=1 Tax=Dendrothele bispora (strain CBS 962.96) TaxID=1314807 RepID=A0A4S8KPW7_DENBC|nr:hypothetical protein K435DRAFT_812308 [Dendrothele bispora CBS 962.96]
MFPINQQLADFRPFVFNTFMERILVPEVGKLLIMEDKGLEGSGGAVEAVSIMRQSSRYGVAMFPEANDIGEESDDGVCPLSLNAPGSRAYDPGLSIICLRGLILVIMVSVTPLHTLFSLVHF